MVPWVTTRLTLSMTVRDVICQPTLPLGSLGALVNRDALEHVPDVQVVRGEKTEAVLARNRPSRADGAASPTREGAQLGGVAVAGPTVEY